VTEGPVTDPAQTLVEEGERYVSIPEWILLHPQLPAPAVRLYGVLKMYARKTERAWPGRATLGGHLGCSEDSIDRYLKALRDVGAVQAIARWVDTDGHTGDRRVYLEWAEGRSQTSNIYRLMWNEPKVANGSGLAAATPQESREGGRKDAAPPSRSRAAGTAAAVRPKAHAVEAHAVGSTTEKLARTIPPAETAPTEDEPTTPFALADRLLVRLGGSISVGRPALVSLLVPAMQNGVPVRRLERAINRLLQDGKQLAPWTLQEYVSKAAASERTGAFA
jgi:hypothetical protein